MTIYNNIKLEKHSFAVLVDPDKITENYILKVAEHCNNGNVNIILVGGSIVSESVDEVVLKLKQLTKIPVIIFPGSPLQLSYKADGVLFLSLISGRNAELLIGHHVLVAKKLKMSKMEVIPTGYILVGGNKISTTEYISNTRAIPADKIDIIVSTAIAGELLGMKTIYLEAGSGAESAISAKIISEIKKNINIPLIVGGGIKNKQDYENVKNAGADVIVVGNAIEQNPDILDEFF